MYKQIYVPVDNSEYSNCAVQKAAMLAQKFGATVIGSHVYAAKMHDYRFKQMEYTLPSEYLLEDEIERQRRIHDSLITMGLELISDSYLDQLGKECDRAGVPHQRKMMDGKHFVEILKDIHETGYDLTVLGALGVGKTRDSVIGAVCEQVARKTDRDLLVIKHLKKDSDRERDTIMVGVDGSPQSFGAVLTGVELAKQFDKKLELVGVYDPYLHYAVFNSIVDVLSEQAAKVFRFEEQNQLHEEIIDCGLAQIYQSHLNVGAKLFDAEACGVEVHKTLLDGKAFQKILQRAREVEPWLLIVGRIGVHSDKAEPGLGSNAENLLRLCPCDILLSTRIEHPELDMRAEETILWTPEAEERMTRVPQAVRGIARTGVLRIALEQGHSVVTNAVIDEAMDRFMPKQSAQITEQLAGKLVLEMASQQDISMCKKCGVVAREAHPVTCAVCAGTEFELLSRETIEKIVSAESGVEEETTYDGRKLRWTKEAREQLLAIEDKYQKRRAKARIEKAARMKRLDTITLEFASAVILDEVGKVLFETVDEAEAKRKLTLHSYDAASDASLIGTDEKGGELRSVFAWSDQAVARFFKVPAGFMRERTQKRIETFALTEQRETVDLELVNRGISESQDAMIDVLVDTGLLSEEQQQMLKDLSSQEKSIDGQSKCPFAALKSQEAKFAVNDITSPIEGPIPNGPVSNVFKGVVSQVLNEIGVISELSKQRQQVKP